jgi:hypothetical protein
MLSLWNSSGVNAQSSTITVVLERQSAFRISNFGRHLEIHQPVELTTSNYHTFFLILLFQQSACILCLHLHCRACKI